MAVDVVTAPHRRQDGQEPVAGTTGLSRRTLLGVIGGAATLGACDRLNALLPDIIAPPGTMPPPPAGGGGGGGGGTPATPGQPIPTGPIATSLQGDAAVHLARRATFGPTPQVVGEIRTLSKEVWLDRQLSPDTEDDPVANAAIARFQVNLERTYKQIFDNRPSKENDYKGNGGANADQMSVNAIVYRNCFSQWQLFEKMCEFWTNHFALFLPDDPRSLSTVWQRDVIRAGCFGTFADLLFAVLTDPAMMQFLNGDENDKGSNENMAREIMELHTLGAGRGYDENDIREVTKLLSGLTYNGQDHVFRYSPGRHYVGELIVRGKVYPNASAEDGLQTMRDFTDDLAADALTAEYLSTKLAQTFVADTPDPELVSTLAAVFQESGGDIRAWVRAMFLDDRFYEAGGQKIARPLDDLVGAIRVMGFTPQNNPDDGDKLLDEARLLLQAPGEHPGPDGYGITADKWLSSGDLLNRWNLHHRLVDGHNDDYGDRYDGFDRALSSEEATLADLVDIDLPATVEQVVDAVAQRLVFQELTPDQPDFGAVLGYLGRAATDQVADEAELLEVVRPVAILLLDTYCMQR